MSEKTIKNHAKLQLEELLRHNERVLKDLRRQIYFDIAKIVVLVVISIITFFIADHFDVKSTINEWLPTMRAYQVKILGTIGIVVTGTGLYYIREKARKYYGILEIAFAVVYGIYALDKLEAIGLVEWLSVIAAVYLVVRGIDNLMTGLKKQIAGDNAESVNIPMKPEASG